MKRYTWEELCDRAENAAHLSPELKAKDQARADLADVIRKETGEYIEASESPEDAIEEWLCNKFADSYEHIMFDVKGNIQQITHRARPFDSVFAFVPEKQVIVYIAEGTGDNLLNEDQEEGYVDYLNYEIYDLDLGMPLYDGGMVLLSAYAYEKYDSLNDAIEDVILEAFDKKMDYFRLESVGAIKAT